MSIVNQAFIPDPGMVTICRSCRAEIFFAATDKKNSDGSPHLMPVDVAPTADGNLAVTSGVDADGRPLPRATVISVGQRAGMKQAGMPVYQAHFRVCPNADDWRKRKKS